MKTTLILSAIAMSLTVQSQTSLETLVTCKDHKLTFTSVVTYPAFELQDFLKVKGLTVEARGFAGSEISGSETGSWALGGALAIRLKDFVAKGYDLGIGVFGRIDNRSAGLYGFIARRF